MYSWVVSVHKLNFIALCLSITKLKRVMYNTEHIFWFCKRLIGNVLQRLKK